MLIFWHFYFDFGFFSSKMITLNHLTARFYEIPGLNLDVCCSGRNYNSALHRKHNQLIVIIFSAVMKQHLRRKGTVDVFFVVVRVHESRSTSSEGDPQLGKFVLSRQVNLNTLT